MTTTTTTTTTRFTCPKIDLEAHRNYFAAMQLGPRDVTGDSESTSSAATAPKHAHYAYFAATKAGAQVGLATGPSTAPNDPVVRYMDASSRPESTVDTEVSAAAAAALVSKAKSKHYFASMMRANASASSELHAESTSRTTSLAVVSEGGVGSRAKVGHARYFEALKT